MPSFGFSVEDNLSQVERSFDLFLAKMGPAVETAFDRVGADMIEHAQGYTGQMRPPIATGNPMRPAHPGQWADITTVLMQGFVYKAERKGRDRYAFTFGNEAEYAAMLEAKEGYWVVSGLFEGFFQARMRHHLPIELSKM